LRSEEEKVIASADSADHAAKYQLRKKNGATKYLQVCYESPARPSVRSGVGEDSRQTL
jgi:hypothetical protein